MEIGVEELCRLVHEAAGVGSGAVMRLAPDVVFPAEDVAAGVMALLEGAGVPAAALVPGAAVAVDGADGEVAGLRAALAFYADRRLYEHLPESDVDLHGCLTRAELDCGDVARAALAGGPS